MGRWLFVLVAFALASAGRSLHQFAHLKGALGFEGRGGSLPIAVSTKIFFSQIAIPPDRNVLDYERWAGFVFVNDMVGR